jgi:hypothetical protein
MKEVTALILLPTEYNPDRRERRRKIPMKDFQEAAVEIMELFRKYGYELGCTIDPYPKHGVWAKLGVIYEDINVAIEIDSFPMKEKNRLIKYCREKLLRRFKQEGILIKFVPRVEAMVVTIEVSEGR